MSKKESKRNYVAEQLKFKKKKRAAPVVLPPRIEPRAGALTGFRYCGDGNDVGRADDPAPVNSMDETCRIHDAAYGELENPKWTYSDADEKFINDYYDEAKAGDYEGPAAQKLAYWFGVKVFQLKRLLNKEGIMPKSKKLFAKHMLKQLPGIVPTVKTAGKRGHEAAMANAAADPVLKHLVEKNKKPRSESKELVAHEQSTVSSGVKGFIGRGKQMRGRRSRARGKVSTRTKRSSSSSNIRKGAKRRHVARKPAKSRRGRKTSLRALKGLSSQVRQLVRDRLPPRYVKLQGFGGSAVTGNTYVNKKIWINISWFSMITAVAPTYTVEDYSGANGHSLYILRNKSYPAYPLGAASTETERFSLRDIRNSAEIQMSSPFKSYVTFYLLECVAPTTADPMTKMLEPIQTVTQVGDSLANQATKITNYVGYSDYNYNPFAFSSMRKFWKIKRKVRKVLMPGDSTVRFSWMRKYFKYFQYDWSEVLYRPGDLVAFMEYHGELVHDSAAAYKSAHAPNMYGMQRNVSFIKTEIPNNIPKEYVEESTDTGALTFANLQAVVPTETDQGVMH